MIFDKFRIMRHLGEALDAVRRSEYRRLTAKDRTFIKGQRYTLLSHRDHLSLDGRRSRAKLLKANKRLNTAYLPKESFGHLWDYQTESGAHAFRGGPACLDRMFPFLSGASRVTDYAAVSRGVRLS